MNKNNDIVNIYKRRKSYFIPFNINKKVDYIFLFLLTIIAHYNEDTFSFDTIEYKSIYYLKQKLSEFGYYISEVTLSRRLSCENDYKYFMTVNKKKKIITLNNIQNTKYYVVLYNNEMDFLLKNNDNFLCKYLIYVKFNCGKSMKLHKEENFTAKLFLSAAGYSDTSHSYLSKISEYNTILKTNKFIEIQYYYTSVNKTRNRYIYNPELIPNIKSSLNNFEESDKEQEIYIDNNTIDESEWWDEFYSREIVNNSYYQQVNNNSYYQQYDNKKSNFKKKIENNPSLQNILKQINHK